MEANVEIIEKPYLLSPETKEELVRECYPLVCQGFVQDPNTELLEDTCNHVLNCDYLWLYTEDSQLKAFITWVPYDFRWVKVLYLGGIMVSPSIQGTGVGSNLTRQAWEKYGGQFLVAQTQNPVLYSSWIRNGFRVYPDLSGVSSGPAKRAAAEVIAARDGAISRPEDPQLRIGAYGKCLYGVKPVDRNQRIQNFFRDNLDFDRGDAVLLVAEKN